MDIPLARLDRQLISRPRFDRPEQVVAWFGAMQAQDYRASLWAVGVRLPRATEPAVESSLAAGRVVRTHLFRGTWQLVAREDARWMLELIGPRVIASWGSRFRAHELDDRTLHRAAALLARAVEDGGPHTRGELAAALKRGRVPATRDRLAHILGHAELSGVLCCNGRRGAQPTWTLLDAAGSGPGSREAAQAELALRYVRSRGPATVSDLAWWSGLPVGEARAALGLVKHELDSETIRGITYWFAPGRGRPARGPAAVLLPAFDEYLVGYRDRGPVLAAELVRQVNAGGGMLSPTVVVGGRVVGIWQRQVARGGPAVAVRPFRRWSPAVRRGVSAAARRYGAYLGPAPITRVTRLGADRPRS